MSRDYKDTLKDAYGVDGKTAVLRFELTKQETARLCRAFASKAGHVMTGQHGAPTLGRVNKVSNVPMLLLTLCTAGF